MEDLSRPEGYREAGLGREPVCLVDRLAGAEAGSGRCSKARQELLGKQPKTCNTTQQQHNTTQHACCTDAGTPPAGQQTGNRRKECSRLPRSFFSATALAAMASRLARYEFTSTCKTAQGCSVVFHWQSMRYVKCSVSMQCFNARSRFRLGQQVVGARREETARGRSHIGGYNMLGGPIIWSHSGLEDHHPAPAVVRLEDVRPSGCNLDTA